MEVRYMSSEDSLEKYTRTYVKEQENQLEAKSSKSKSNNTGQQPARYPSLIDQYNVNMNILRCNGVRGAYAYAKPWNPLDDGLKNYEVIGLVNSKGKSTRVLLKLFNIFIRCIKCLNADYQDFHIQKTKS